MPPVINQAILLGIAAIVQYLLDNVGLLNIPPLYAPFVTLAGATVLKMIQEAMPKKATPAAQARAMAQPMPEKTYWQRVLFG